MSGQGESAGGAHEVVVDKGKGEELDNQVPIVRRFQPVILPAVELRRDALVCVCVCVCVCVRVCVCVCACERASERERERCRLMTTPSPHQLTASASSHRTTVTGSSLSCHTLICHECPYALVTRHPARCSLYHTPNTHLPEPCACQSRNKKNTYQWERWREARSRTATDREAKI